MKNFLFFILSAICTIPFFTSCDDDCDHNISSNDNDVEICGTWYNELMNEEIRYYQSGMFYSKSATKDRSAMLEGRFEYNKKNRTLTWTYDFMGQTEFLHWKIKDFADNRMTIYSPEIGDFKYEKVDTVYSLKVGEIVNLSDKIVARNSTNERIAKVNKNGAIEAVGGKGNAYIKLASDNSESWVKVIVGDDCLDLWYDYVNIIGLNYSEMKQMLGNPSYSGTDGFTYAYNLPNHNLIDHISVNFDEYSGKVNNIILFFVDDSPTIEIFDYLKAHYYLCKEFEDDIYMSEPVLGFSKATIMYDEEYHALVIGQTFDKFRWLEFTDDFGSTIDDLVRKYGELYMGELPLYFFKNHLYLENVYFFLDNNTKRTTAYEVELKKTVPAEYINEMLSFKYKFFKKDGNIYGYRDAETEEEATLLVVYDADQSIVDYFDLKNYGKSTDTKGIKNDVINLFME